MLDTLQLQLLLATFAAWANRKQAGIIAYLIEENRVLKEQLESSGKRLRLTDSQRRRLAVKGKPLGRKILREIAPLVSPDTILAWHRKLIAAKWTLSSDTHLYALRRHPVLRTCPGRSSLCEITPFRF